jgi:predicted nuclease of predicted toxin-antitoxin system
VKFLVDNQLPAALVHFLVSRGHDCEHVFDVGLARASDAEVWRYASEREGIIVSKDEDFLYLAAGTETPARVLWVRIGNCRTVALLAHFGRVWLRIEAALKAGERVVEVR